MTYWGATGITKTGSTATTPSRSNKAAGQNITVSGVVNDNFVSDIGYVTDENGAIVLNIGTGDNYYISVRHDADSYYTEAEKTISNNIKFNVNVTSQTTNNWTVNITAKSNIPNDIIGGRLLFILPHNIEINATYVADGIWWAEYTFDNYGNYQISASYIGHDNVSISNATVSIIKANSTISLDVPVLEYGNSVRLAVNTTGALGITAEIYDGQILAVMGNVIILPDDLKAGPHALIITALPDADHIGIKKTVPIYIEKAKTQLAASAVTATYNVNSELVISLTDGQGRQLKGAVVSVDLNGVKNYTTDSDGLIALSTQGLIPNVYTVNIAFEGNGYYGRSNATTTVTILKDGTNLVAEAVTATYNVNKDLVISLTDGQGRQLKGAVVSVDLNGVKNYTTDSDGLIALSTQGLIPNVYTVNIAFEGNGYYGRSNATTTVTILKDGTNLVAEAVTAIYNVNRDLVISLTDSQGRPLNGVSVSVNINGNKAYATDKNGQIKINVANLVPKTYTAKMTFNGNSKYEASSASVKVTVKKANAKMVAKKKTFKSKVKTKKYTITLKNNVGKAIKNAKITIKIKNKTYREKTNANGKAVFKIKKLTKKGTFKAKVKFAGNTYYNAVTKTVKIQIK